MYSVSKNYSKTSPTFFAWFMGAMDCQATQSLMHKMRIKNGNTACQGINGLVEVQFPTGNDGFFDVLSHETNEIEGFPVSLPLSQSGWWYTPLKNMSSSAGIILPNIWKIIKTMFQTTNQISH